ncbi:MAG: ABC transporter permease [Betaproteobacteria bacterium]
MNANRRLYAIALVLMAAGLFAPAGWLANTAAFSFALIACAGAAVCLWPSSPTVDHVAATAGLIAGAAGTLVLLSGPGPFGLQAPGLWLFVAGWTVFLWQRLDVLARSAGHGVAALLAPGLFGLALLYLWQVVVTGFAVPQVLLPSPSQVATVLGSRSDILWPDFRQTFLKAVLAGFAIGNTAGFLTAMLADRIPFLKRGLLPLCNLASAMPIVGIAPIMVMWFGFDWASKAAVVAVVTFFPMLVNTLAGLASVDAMHRDLMHSYGASFGQTFAKLRLPSALPFVFNALKVNSTLALIAAIVAEFFGSPILGLGFRISTEVARLNVDVVWAVIAVAALAGSVFYGAIAALERVFTFWHPSYRR